MGGSGRRVGSSATRPALAETPHSTTPWGLEVEKLEELWGFEQGHTVSAVKSAALQETSSSWLRKHLLSRGIMTKKLEAKLAEMAAEWNLPGGADDDEESEKEVLWRGWDEGEKLVVEHLRGVDHRGSDVRLDTGRLMSPSCCPRRSIRPELWKWENKFSLGWKHAEHINVLGARTTLNAMKWQVRSKKGIAKKYLHLVDSQVVQAVLTKHRSTSKVLNHVCQKVCALELAESCHHLLGFVRSDTNPADAPSRSATGRELLPPPTLDKNWAAEGSPRDGDGRSSPGRLLAYSGIEGKT